MAETKQLSKEDRLARLRASFARSNLMRAWKAGQVLDRDQRAILDAIPEWEMVETFESEVVLMKDALLEIIMVVDDPDLSLEDRLAKIARHARAHLP